jgi:hypothetical protein
MKALSEKQPFGYLICAGIKDIENRTWKTNFRGRVLIHASSKTEHEPYMIFTDEQYRAIEIADKEIDLFESYKIKSAIIGSVEIVDCIKGSESIWADNRTFVHKGEITHLWHWVLKNPMLFNKPIENVKGKLGFWEYEHTETYLGRKVKELRIFNEGTGDFGNLYKAQGWLRERGYEYGSLCCDLPVALE